MLARAPLILLAVLAAGCTTQPTKCYVTLDPKGAPTAEACETGAQLVVRPITKDNAAAHVPPYVLGALSYEGFVAGPAGGEAEMPLAKEPPANEPLADEPQAERPLAEAPDEVRQHVKGLVKGLVKGKRYRVTVRRVVTPPPNRIDGSETAGGEVRYRRPFHARLSE